MAFMSVKDRKKPSAKIEIRGISHGPRKKILTKILEINANLCPSFTHGRT